MDRDKAIFRNLLILGATVGVLAVLTLALFHLGAVS